ncbi:MAG: BPL-N domain-containing protein [Tepidisphaeraceae bacterium]
MTPVLCRMVRGSALLALATYAVAFAPAANVLVVAEQSEATPLGPGIAAKQLSTWTLTPEHQLTVKSGTDAAATGAAVSSIPADYVFILREHAVEDAAKASIEIMASAQANELAQRIATLLSAPPAAEADPAVPKQADDAAALSATISAPPVHLGPLETTGDLGKLASGKAVIVIDAPSNERLPVSQRARMFRVAVNELLAKDLKAYDKGLNHVLPDAEKGVRRIGVYDGLGSNRSPGPEAMYGILSTLKDVRVTFVGPSELRDADAVKQFDVLMFPGGSGSGQARALGPTGRANVKSWVDAGGAYVGNCAGGYFASSGYKWSLGLLNVTTVDSAHWNRGTGDVQVELTDDGKHLLGDHATITLKYANGPIFAPANRSDLPAVTVLAHYRSELAKNGAVVGAMVNTPAVVTAPFGHGRVVAFSCHPEYSKDYKDFIVKAVDWATSAPSK